MTTRPTVSSPLALALPALSLFATFATAQADPNRFVPRDAQVVMRIAAPAKWKAQFADTKVARVFGSQALAPMIEQVTTEISKGLEEAERQGVDPQLLEDSLSKYMGDTIIALRVDLEDLPAAIEEDRPPAMAMTMAASPDDSYDLAALAEAITAMAEERVGDRLTDVVVGDHTLRCVFAMPGNYMSLPTMIDGHFVMMFATDLERVGATMLATDNRREDTGVGKPMYLHVDVEQGVQTMLDVVGLQMENDINAPPIDVVQMLTDLGLGCLRTIEVSVAADGDQAVIETNLSTSSENRGLIGAFVLDRQSLDLLRYLPESAASFGCQPFDLGAVYTTVANVWGAASAMTPMSFEDVEFMFEDATTVRLREDLIDHIGKEVLYLSDYSAAEDVDPDDISAMFAGSCYGLALTDGKAFGESLEKALRSRGMHAARKSEEYQGVKVYRLRLGGVIEVEYAVTDDLLLLTLGSDDSSRAQLRSVLDARANPRAGLPASLARHVDDVPAGWNGIGITPMATVMTQVGEMMAEAPPGELPPQMETLLKTMGMIGAEMKRAGVDDAVQFSYTSSTGIRTITRL